MLKEGTVIGQRYEVISRIGGGGMADVYKARDHKLNRLVAVKIMKSEFKEDPTFIQKFRKEAQAAAGLAHPNIVNVYDVGDDGGLYYIVMELVEGITLKDYITKKGRLSVKEATSIAIQVSLGLQAAHSRGIIHRDVKPQNIIISTDGKVKLSDFGIAKATNSNTITSNVMGSVHYSSPEQVRGGFSNAKSDIYSLGVTLYEMVTGRVPFDGETTVAIAIKHLQEEIEPPTKYAPDLPYSLEQIILKCTQKSPDRRYESTAELIEDLKHSLIDPQGDFVKLTPLSAHAQTVMMSPGEMETIRSTVMRGEGRGTDAADYGYPEEKNDYGSYEDEDDEYDDYEDEDDDRYDEDDDEEEGSSGLEKAITIGGFVIGAIAICILIYLIAQAAGFLDFGKKEPAAAGSSSSISSSAEQNGDQVAVPDLTNKSQTDAESELNSMGLGGKYMGEEASDTVTAGLICRQEIAPGELVDKNTTVNYWVSSGPAPTEPTEPEQVVIPDDLIGKSEQEATQALADLGLGVGTVSRENSADAAIGTVISTDPGTGTSVDAGSTVNLVVSIGPEENKKVSIGNYSGLPYEEIMESLSGQGLEVEIVYGSSNKCGVGEIYDQSTPDGSEMPVGSKITLYVNDPDKAEPEEGSTQEPEENGGENGQESETGSENNGGESAGNGDQGDQTGTGAAQQPTKKYGVDVPKPEDYDGGAVDIVLYQDVNGTTQSTTLASGTEISDWVNGQAHRVEFEIYEGASNVRIEVLSGGDTLASHSIDIGG